MHLPCDSLPTGLFLLNPFRGPGFKVKEGYTQTNPACVHSEHCGFVPLPEDGVSALRRWLLGGYD
jgi:hypothetical protein